METRERPSLRIVPPAAPFEPPPALRLGEPADPRSGQVDKRTIFKGMVVAALDAGFLRYSRRQELMGYAKQLNIPEFEATLLIAEAQYHSGDIAPIKLSEITGVDLEPPAGVWSIRMRLSFALAAAVFIDLLLIYWLF